MFRCAITKKVSKPGEPMIKLVVETRPVEYTNHVQEPDTSYVKVIHSKGWEIVKEIAVTEAGYQMWIGNRG